MKKWIVLILLLLCLALIGRIYDAYANPIEIRKKSCLTPTSTPESSPSYHYGKASWYGAEFCGGKPCKTASGAWFDENDFTTACSDKFPLGTKFIVSHNENSIEVVCNDRGGFTKNYSRILDLSKKAFETLAPTSKGVIWVRVKVVD